MRKPCSRCFRHGEAVGWAQSGLAAAIPRPRINRGETVPVGPAWEEVQPLLASAAGNRPGDLRVRAILLLLAVYGLRSGKVRFLRLEDLDWEVELLRVRCPKMGCTRLYPVAFLVDDGSLTAKRGVNCSSLNGFYRYALERGLATWSPLSADEPCRQAAATFRTLLLVVYGARVRLGDALHLSRGDIDME